MKGRNSVDVEKFSLFGRNCEGVEVACIRYLLATARMWRVELFDVEKREGHHVAAATILSH